MLTHIQTYPLSEGIIFTFYEQLPVLKLSELRQYHILCTPQTNIRTKSPPYLYEKFVFQNICCLFLLSHSFIELINNFYLFAQLWSTRQYNKEQLYSSFRRCNKQLACLSISVAMCSSPTTALEVM